MDRAIVARIQNTTCFDASTKNYSSFRFVFFEFYERDKKTSLTRENTLTYIEHGPEIRPIWLTNAQFEDKFKSRGT